MKYLDLCARSPCFCSDLDNNFIYTFLVLGHMHAELCSVYLWFPLCLRWLLTVGVCWHVKCKRDPLSFVAGMSTVKSGRQPSYNPCTSWVHLKLAVRRLFCGEDSQRAYSTFTQHGHACKCAWSDNVKISTPFFLFFCSSGSRRVGNEEITALVNSPSERCDMLKCNDLACWTETEHCFKPQRCRGWEPREKRGTEAKVSYPN